jgi:sugar/nucleoside kinase (ribokinase family)
MAQIVVLGDVNVDRIWRLGHPLQAGGRNTFGLVERRIGGGGFNTGCALLALGHQVSLVTSLGDDENGGWCRAALRETGFETANVRLHSRPTALIEILVDPLGDRTILAPSDADGEVQELTTDVSADLAYIASRKVKPDALSDLLRRMDVIAQIPLDAGERRPATVLIGSSSDLDERGQPDLFAFGRRIAGPSLQRVILTSGAREVHMWDRHGETRVAVDLRPAAEDTTGAGDVFAAGFIDAHLRGDTPEEAVRRGSELAGLFLDDRRTFIDPPQPRARAFSSRRP